MLEKLVSIFHITMIEIVRTLVRFWVWIELLVDVHTILAHRVFIFTLFNFSIIYLFPSTYVLAMAEHLLRERPRKAGPPLPLTILQCGTHEPGMKFVQI